MKKFFSFFTICFFVLFTNLVIISPVFSQSNIIDINDSDTTAEEEPDELTTQEENNLYEEDRPAEIIDTVSLRAEFRQYVQDPGSKEVKFEMILRSNITSDRVKITWNVIGVTLAVDEEELERTISVEEGKTYAIPITVRPLGSGISEITGRAEAFLIDGNVVATVRKNYASNADGEILPITEEYENEKTQRTLTRIITFVVGGIVLLVGGFFGLKWFVKWYDRDEVKAFEENYRRQMGRT